MTKRKDQSYRSEKCLNCNTPLDVSEKYCHYCGQLNSTKKITVSDFFEEFVSNFYAYDSRLRNTLFFLFSKPGYVAKQIVNGKRQTFANPFRLFLSIIIMFFIFDNLQNSYSTKEKKDLGQTELEESLLTNKFQKDSIYTYKEIFKDSISTFDQYYYQITSFRNYNLKNPNQDSEKAIETLGYENNRINRFLYHKSENLKSNNLKREIGDYFISKLPFLIFLALPLLTIIFWLVFYNKKYNYAEVLVFTYTFYTFIFISLLSLEFVKYLNEDLSIILKSICFILIFPIYLYKSLRYFYETSRWKTIFKFVLLNLLFLPAILITSFFVISVALLFF